jgi:hypothetical protein
MIRQLTSEEKRFEEGEVRSLLARAMELQRGVEEETNPVGKGGSPRLTLAEIRQIAAEVGVEPHYLDLAAAEQERGTAPKQRFHILGAPTAVERERVLPGAITPEKWERIVPELRLALGKVGVVEQLGQSYAWTSPQELDYLALTREEEGTRLTIRSDPFAWFLVYFPGIFPYLFGFLALITLSYSPLVELPIAAGAAGTLFSLQRLLLRRLMGSHEKTIDRLIGRIASILAE